MGDKILVVGCKKTMDDACIGCSRCLVGFNRRVGAFADLGDDAEMIGLMHCGDCPGASVVHRLTQMALWNKPMAEQPTRVHIASCITDHCPYQRKLCAKIEAVSGVPVVRGAHPFRPQVLFTS